MSAPAPDGDHQALVIPADPSLPVRVVEYAQPREATSMIRREIGCQLLDLTPQLPSRFGRFALWVDDNGLYRQPVEHNDRAVALCRAHGYDVSDLARTVVVTGMDAAGNVRTLPPGLRDWLIEAFDRLRARQAANEQQNHQQPTTGHDRRHHTQQPAARKDAAPGPARDTRREAHRTAPPRRPGNRPAQGPAPS